MKSKNEYQGPYYRVDDIQFDKEELHYLDRMIALKQSSDLIYLDSISKVKNNDREIVQQIDFIRDQVQSVKNNLKDSRDKLRSANISVNSGQLTSNNYSQSQMISFPQQKLDNDSDRRTPKTSARDGVRNQMKKLHDITSLNRFNNSCHSSPIRQHNHNFMSEFQSKLQQITEVQKNKIKDEYQHKPSSPESHVNVKSPFRDLRILSVKSIQQPISHRQSNNYLFCLFSKLSNSSMMKLLTPCKLQVIQEDQSKKTQKIVYYNLTNALITNYFQISQIIQERNNIRTILLLGGKSTSKQVILSHIIESLIPKHNCQIQVYLSYAINGFLTAETMLKHIPYEFTSQEVKLYQTETFSYNRDEIIDGINYLFRNVKSDTYFRLKKYLHDHMQISQIAEQRRLLRSISQNLSSVKVLQMNLKIDGYSQQYYIITTNNVTMDRAQNLLQEGTGTSLIMRGLDLLNHANLRIFCINPLRYRLQDTQHTLQLFKQQ